jgi:hypothetical protein
MKVRDAWIGRDDGTRQRRLQRVVSKPKSQLLPALSVGVYDRTGPFFIEKGKAGSRQGLFF